MGGLSLSSNNTSLPNEIRRSNLMRASAKHRKNENHNSRVLLRILKIAVVAKDEGGCYYLRQRIDEGDDVEAILLEVMDDLYELMMHPSACLLIQHIFQARRTVSVSNRDSLVFRIVYSKIALRNVCMDTYGTRAILTMLENIESLSVMYLVVFAIKNITAELMINDNGNYVIIECVKLFPPECQQVILDEVARNCVHIAKDKTGSIAVKECLFHADKEAMIFLVTEIVSNAMFLAEDPNGKCVLQYLIHLKLSSRNEEIIVKLLGNYVRLSKNMYASNVVEALLALSEQDYVGVIVKEIIESNDFLSVLQDFYGNYIAQTALQCTQGYLHEELSEKIKFYSKDLLSHPFGKKLLKKAYKDPIDSVFDEEDAEELFGLSYDKYDF